MKFNRIIIFTILSFVIGLILSLNYLGVLLSPITSNSYIQDVLTGILFIIGILIFYLFGQKYELRNSIIRTAIPMYVGVLIGYVIGWLVLFQLNPLYHAYYGDVIYYEALFISAINSIPAVLAGFTGLALAYIRNPPSAVEEEKKPSEEGAAATNKLKEEAAVAEEGEPEVQESSQNDEDEE